MSQTIDQRPPVAVGHVRLPTTDVAGAARWLETVGLRPIFEDADLAVLERRGGTHVVVRPVDEAPKISRSVALTRSRDSASFGSTAAARCSCASLA